MHMAERFLVVCNHCHKGISSRLLYLPSWAPQRPLLLSLAADQGEAASVKAPLVATKHHWSATFYQCQQPSEAGTFLMPGFFLFRLQVCNIKKTSRGLFFFISSFVLSLKSKTCCSWAPLKTPVQLYRRLSLGGPFPGLQVCKQSRRKYAGIPTE